jgi:hypothetical protein
MFHVKREIGAGPGRTSSGRLEHTKKPSLGRFSNGSYAIQRPPGQKHSDAPRLKLSELSSPQKGEKQIYRSLNCVGLRSFFGNCYGAWIAKVGRWQGFFEMEERRKHPRAEVDELAYICGDGSSTRCRVLNVSPEGAAVEVPNPSFLPARFKLMTAKDCVVRNCRVIWIRQNTVGVAFE